MGITKCKIHGRSQLLFTCQHVANQIRSGEAPEGHYLDVMSHMLVCNACYKVLGFGRFIRFEHRNGFLEPAPNDLKPDDEVLDAFEAAHEALKNAGGGDIFCFRCAADLQARVDLDGDGPR
jgi:hypothetical protein